MKMEAETGVIGPQAKGCLEHPEAGRSRKDPFLWPSRRAWLCNTLILDIWPLELGEHKSLWFQLPTT